MQRQALSDDLQVVIECGLMPVLDHLCTVWKSHLSVEEEKNRNGHPKTSRAAMEEVSVTCLRSILSQEARNPRLHP